MRAVDRLEVNFNNNDISNDGYERIIGDKVGGSGDDVMDDNDDRHNDMMEDSVNETGPYRA
ncbi:hypothetical protein Q9L58_009068 [Maublancomyces gigas]|uniref:Uncharacterized protein n=1 Tax=Discina gigas TaxID=1032678 RepID=A0ABR3G804_9PEZI